MFQIFPFIIFFRLLRKLFYFFLTFSFFSDFFFRFTGFHRQAWGYSISCTPSSIIMFDLFNFNAPSYKASIVFQDFLLLHIWFFFHKSVFIYALLYSRSCNPWRTERAVISRFLRVYQKYTSKMILVYAFQFPSYRLFFVSVWKIQTLHYYMWKLGEARSCEAIIFKVHSPIL